jgi:glycosyltransferase involved in cell wall biosynthesis
MKKTILHIIDNLGRGGAETMLVTVTKQLGDFNNIIVTLYPENEFGEDLKCDQLICLNLQSNFHIPAAAFKLRKIIKENNVDIVHSHLFWSTVVARLGTPKKIPLITTIHSFVASSLEYRPWRMHVIEKLTYKVRKSIIVAVAKGALDEYFNFINVKPHKACSLYTFVDPAVFNEENNIQKENVSPVFRIVSVGNLKEQKNHRFLLDAFKELKNENICLDIYGKGQLEPSLQKTIDEQQIKVTLKGQVKDIQKRIKQYDLFVMSSLYEGFALSVLEAMALRMPLLLSDIVSFKEQCADTAVYYDLNNSSDFVSKLKALMKDQHQLKMLGEAAKKRVLENFTLEKHLQQLKGIYADTLGFA